VTARAAGFVEDGSWVDPILVLDAESIAGIDPGGATGAIAVLSRLRGDGTLCGRFIAPKTERAWVGAIRAMTHVPRLRMIHVEDVSMVPPFRAQDLKLHRAVGIIHGALWTISESWATIPAREWRRGLGLAPEKDYKRRKIANAERVRALWPGHIITTEAVDAAGIVLNLARRSGWLVV
jgi:hypothetical protein